MFAKKCLNPLTNIEITDYLFIQGVKISYYSVAFRQPFMIPENT